MGDDWIRHIRSDPKEKFAKGINEDNEMYAIFQQYIGVNTEIWSSIANERLRLSICIKEYGLGEAEYRRFRQYLGATNQSITVHLGAKGNSIMGLLHTPAIANLFGEGPFSYPFIVPWKHLLTNSIPKSNIATGK